MAPIWTFITLLLATWGIGMVEQTISGWCGWLQTFQNTVFSLIPSGFQKDAAKDLLTQPASKWIALSEGVALLILVPMFIMAIRRRFRR